MMTTYGPRSGGKSWGNQTREEGCESLHDHDDTLEMDAVLRGRSIKIKETYL